jgi:hypothetical protein
MFPKFNFQCFVINIPVRCTFIFFCKPNPTNITVLLTFRPHLIHLVGKGRSESLMPQHITYAKQQSCEIFVETNLINPKTVAEHRNINSIYKINLYLESKQNMISICSISKQIFDKHIGRIPLTFERCFCHQKG